MSILGFRVRELIPVATLINVHKNIYTDIGKMYPQRSSLEVHRRLLEVSLHLEDLGGRCRAAVPRETWTQA